MGRSFTSSPLGLGLEKGETGLPSSLHLLPQVDSQRLVSGGVGGLRGFSDWLPAWLQR